MKGGLRSQIYIATLMISTANIAIVKSLGNAEKVYIDRLLKGEILAIGYIY